MRRKHSIGDLIQSDKSEEKHRSSSYADGQLLHDHLLQRSNETNLSNVSTSIHRRTNPIRDPKLQPFSEQHRTINDLPNKTNQKSKISNKFIY